MDLSFTNNLGVKFNEAYPAVLFGYELKINVQDESNPNFGYANIMPNKGSFVEGVLMKVTKEDILLLDSYEGYPDLYLRSKMNIFLPNRNKAYDAWVYTGKSNCIVNRNLLLSKSQKKRINNGFSFLTLEYQNKLLKIIS